MKKNVIIAALSLVTILSVGFAFIQRAEAEKAKITALEQKVLAEENAQRARELEVIAARSRKEAEAQKNAATQQRALAAENEKRAVEILRKCQTRK